VTADLPPLYQRDPDAYREHLAEGNARQPRKRVSADMLLRDQRGQILLVNPTYKPDWDMPGGMAEGNEPPAEAAQREVHEELALDIQPQRLLCVDWVPPHDPWDDLLAFIFDGGVLTDEQIDGIRLLDGEIHCAEFLTADQASRRLSQRTWRRLHAAIQALDNGAARYLQDGQPLA
jgi:8-oxo-dGTP diphosphatase